jgi:hypothetical protein
VRYRLDGINPTTAVGVVTNHDHRKHQRDLHSMIGFFPLLWPLLMLDLCISQWPMNLSLRNGRADPEFSKDGARTGVKLADPARP